MAHHLLESLFRRDFLMFFLNINMANFILKMNETRLDICAFCTIGRLTVAQNENQFAISLIIWRKRLFSLNKFEIIIIFRFYWNLRTSKYRYKALISFKFYHIFILFHGQTEKTSYDVIKPKLIPNYLVNRMVAKCTARRILEIEKNLRQKHLRFYFKW